MGVRRGALLAPPFPGPPGFGRCRSPVYDVGPFRALVRGAAGQTAQEDDERVGLAVALVG
jgi:hypothetical protein